MVLNVNDNAKIILISSILGIQKHNGSSAMIYRASKAAVNNVMVSISEELKSENITVVSFHPGWVRTDMGGPNGDISTHESAAGLLQRFDELTLADTCLLYTSPSPRD